MREDFDIREQQFNKRERDFENALRPLNFSDFNGQDKVVDNLRIFVKAARLRGEALDHVLLHGPPGLGKTTLSNIIANELGVGFKVTSGPVLDKPGDLAGVLTSLEPNDVLFIDEIHRLSPVVEEYLYSAMEDYRIDIMIDKGPSARSIQLELSPFTLVGATTRSGLLTAPLRAMLESFASSSFYGNQYALYKIRKAYNDKRYTPERINHLKDNEIFVFGSNLSGSHGGGAASVAHRWFGAIWGCGVGIQGQSYAIPTMHGGVKEIKPFVDEFILYAKEHPEQTFLVTRIGCGIAGFRDEEIAPLFEGCEESDNIILPKSFHEVLERMAKKSDNREEFDLSRFHEAQAMHYQIALAEIQDGYTSALL